MLCGISGETPTEPVVSTKTGTIFEKRLIEQYIREHGTEPGQDEPFTVQDLLPVKTSRLVRPRPPTLTSIPALLGVFQNEWDAVALETYKLQEELAKTRQELATALYQQDAAVRVVARLTRERDEARDALSRITVSGAGSGANGGAGEEMAIDSVETLPEAVVERIEETEKKMSKTRKKRPIPSGWITPDQVASLAAKSTTDLPVPQASSIAVEGAYAAVAGLDGEAAIFFIDGAKAERQVSVGEPVTDAVWKDTRLMFATSKGSVKVFDSGNEVASFSNHAGAVTGLSLHPSGDILASVGADKSLVFYDLTTMARVGRCYSDSGLLTCAFHPDGHLIAAGAASGEIKLFMTKNLEQAETYSLGSPVQAVTFSENGFWLAATAKGQNTVTIFDLRKQGDASTAKVLDVGGSVASLCWDYTGQFLATAGASGVTVQQYLKGSKKWSEPFRNATPAVRVAWGEDGQKLVAVGDGGVVSVFAPEE